MRRLAGPITDPTFLLLYSPLQFAPEEQAKPDGSLSLPYVAASLRRAGYEVRILDASVGNEKDSLQESFFHPTELPGGLIRVGMTRERIAEEMASADVIGISSIFTTQTSMVFELVRLAKEIDPGKLVVAGGVNARNLRDRFFRAGVDVIALSEAEGTILDLADWVRGKKEITDVPGIAYLAEDGHEILNPAGPVLVDLDELPLPAWDLLPLEQYWEISRPHGGEFGAGERIQYASLQTTRGCPYRCTYCHISKEGKESVSGAIGNYRMHSIDRVLAELQTLKDLGATHVFFEDDSLFARKKRAYRMFREVATMGLQLADVNGINLCHLLRNDHGKLVLDKEFLEVLATAGFTWLTLPFESGNQRIIDQYATAKWNLGRTDTEAMIRTCADLGIRTVGNYMVGYPDETLEEIQTTILFAKRHMEWGLNHALFFAVVPFPGSVLYERAIANGQLDRDFDTDEMKWTRSVLRNTPVPAELLDQMRQLAWLTVNRSAYVDYKIRMRVATPVVATGVGAALG